MGLSDATSSAASKGDCRSRYGTSKLKEGNYPVWRWNPKRIEEMKSETKSGNNGDAFGGYASAMLAASGNGKVVMIRTILFRI